MEQMKQKITTFYEALITLEDSIALYDEYKKKFHDIPTRENERLFKGMRDSIIQRFEYCTDFFWKILKLYLEDIEKVVLPSYSPREIIREAVTIKMISEREGSPRNFISL